VKRAARAVLAIGISAGVLAPSQSFAWEKHATLMPSVLWGLSQPLREQLKRTVSAPCRQADVEMYPVLADRLKLNKAHMVSPTIPTNCVPGDTVELTSILAGAFVDDPDMGMDENLDESHDPHGYRQWMGGKKGPTSKGFRHMYFGGWRLTKPIATFQIPIKAVGESPERVELLANTAKELIKSGNTAWGFRVLAWAIHYTQDLAQPFHAVQIPKLAMVPWYSIFKGFGNLVSETTRTIGNYHWAYEDYVKYRIELGKDSPFQECMLKAENYAAEWVLNAKLGDHRRLALAVADASVKIGAELGSAEYKFFGGQLKLPEFDLPAGQGKLDYADLSVRPDVMDGRQELHQVTCRALANGVVATRKLIEWALQP